MLSGTRNQYIDDRERLSNGAGPASLWERPNAQRHRLRAYDPWQGGGRYGAVDVGAGRGLSEVRNQSLGCSIAAVDVVEIR